MQLSEHFSMAEFCITQHREIPNDIPINMIGEARRTAAMLERIREHLGKKAGHATPIIISSGYRCRALNVVVGSKDTSDHLTGMAADFVAPTFGSPYAIAQALSLTADELGIGQLIHEYGTWVHVSTRRPQNPVNRIITISGRGPVAGVVRV